MCSCNRDRKSQHSDACRAAHEKYNTSAAGAERSQRYRDWQSIKDGMEPRT